MKSLFGLNYNKDLTKPQTTAINNLCKYTSALLEDNFYLIVAFADIYKKLAKYKVERDGKFSPSTCTAIKNDIDISTHEMYSLMYLEPWNEELNVSQEFTSASLELWIAYKDFRVPFPKLLMGVVNSLRDAYQLKLNEINRSTTSKKTLVDHFIEEEAPNGSD